ncbi:hypothetical protein J2W56_005499 [Nocardia kruczakiae]|uniref:Uncharacterized protein n=1 Tax=Nocardia kruczakiae TaxID=261477 RepID=A0ABU1XMF6_9NOCA|nr:hypothetical protein [Nocardia kruczakiae]MDR7171738.1 hypothetical protein [Nocardia kruczakiae]
MTTPTTSEPIAQLRAARDRAADTRNLARALELDNELEDLGQLGNAPRRTCWRCGSWADHVHEPHTGARMAVHGGLPADEAYTAVAVQVFAHAATALPHHWSETDGVATVVVDLGAHRFAVTVHPGDGNGSHGYRRDVYISHCLHRPTGQARAFPAIHAPWQRTAAIVAAYRYARNVGMSPTPPATAEPLRTDHPDDLLRRLRIRHSEIDAEIDGHAIEPDDDHRERLAALYRDAVALATALDAHLSSGGALPQQWAHATTA